MEDELAVQILKSKEDVIGNESQVLLLIQVGLLLQRPGQLEHEIKDHIEMEL